MKTLDRLLQRWRIAKALPYLKNSHRVLDIGTHDGALFKQLNTIDGTGVDPKLIPGTHHANTLFINGLFPQNLKDQRPFDVIVLLAVLEHIPRKQQAQLANDCFNYLTPGGRVIVTTPSPLVDKLLDVLFMLRVIDAMGETHDQHYGFKPAESLPLFLSAGFTLIRRRRFQLGLNNLFVFERPQ